MTRKLALLILVAFTCASGGLTQAAELSQPSVDSQMAQDQDDDFLIGIGYATDHLAAPFATLGAQQAKLSYGASRWDHIEPAPPEGDDHKYSWTNLDHIVTEYQEAGYSEIHMTLQSKSPWGTEAGCVLDTCRPSPPKPEHWDDYEDYVRAVVERYDGDGYKDMPGLRHPVRQYEIETEADDWWHTPCPETLASQYISRTNSYLQLLDTAQSVAREAYPEVQILPGAMLFYGLFSGEPDEATIVARRDEVTTMDCIMTFNEEILRHPELFDAVEFHFLGDDYREIAATVRWLREQMHANGYQKPIYPTDIPTGPALVPTSPYTETFLYPQDIATEYLDIIQQNIFSDTVTQEYQDIRAWYAEEQAAFSVKLMLAAMEEGAAGIQLATMTDFPWMFCTPNWHYAVYAIWSWGIHGLADVDWGPFIPIFCMPIGYEFEQPRPAFHTLSLSIDKLRGFSTVERLQLPSSGGSAEAYAYRVWVRNRSVHVIWIEDDIGQVMGGTKPTASITLPVASTTVTVTHIITQPGQIEPLVEVLETTDGSVVLEVNEYPIFVEAPQQKLYLPLVVKDE